MAPGLGAEGGKFQVSTGWHSAWAHRDYFDSRFNRSFTRLWRPYERISVFDVSARYNVNRRFSVTLTLPVVFNRFSTLLPPQGPDRGKRYGFNANQLGDATIYTQTWLLDSQKHPHTNIAFGLGMKLPTGNWNVRKVAPDEAGKNFARRAIYPAAIMPGDGGVGVIFGLNAYHTVRRTGPLRGTTLFASGQYMVNPRNTNGTPSMVSSLGVPLNGRFASALTNSVADGYSWQAGAAFKVPMTWKYENFRGMRLRFVTGMEGTPTHDLIGGSSGFRQPGYTITIGPGFSWARKKDFIIVEVPLVIGQHINPGRTLLPGLPAKGPGNTILPGNFNAMRQIGLVAPLAISVRYVRAI
jgi:hypothetical protein